MPTMNYNKNLLLNVLKAQEAETLEYEASSDALLSVMNLYSFFSVFSPLYNLFVIAQFIHLLAWSSLQQFFLCRVDEKIGQSHWMFGPMTCLNHFGMLYGNVMATLGTYHKLQGAMTD